MASARPTSVCTLSLCRFMSSLEVNEHCHKGAFDRALLFPLKMSNDILWLKIALFAIFGSLERNFCIEILIASRNLFFFGTFVGKLQGESDGERGREREEKGSDGGSGRLLWGG